MRKEFIRGSLYTIDEQGNIETNLGKKVNTWKETNTGYTLFRIKYPNCKEKCLRLHRILAESFIPNPEDHPFVRHLDDDKGNNELSNLSWGTNATNVKEGYDNGCYAFKTRKHGVKVTYHESDVIEVYPSLRALSDNTEFNRKNVAAVLKGRKVNTYQADFEYVEGLV